MADVRGASGVPGTAAFGGISTPTPSTPLYVDLANGDLYALINSAVAKIAQASITSGTSGGIPYYSSTTTIASSALLVANQLVLGGGVGTAPATLGSLGTTTTVLHGNAAGAPTFGSVVLTTDVSGILPIGNGGTGNALGNANWGA